MNTPKKLNPAEFARKFVTIMLARQLPAEAITAALDAGTLWKGLRAELAIYAQHQDAVIIRPDDAPLILPPGVWEGLTPAKRKEFRNAINKEAAAHRQMLAAVRRFVEGQAAAVDAGSPAFREAYAERFEEYATPAA